MQPMAINRRQLTTVGIALLADSLIGTAGRAGERNVIAATTRNADATHSAAIYDLNAGPLRVMPLPMRGHDIAVNPATKTCVAFARRPGNFAVAFGVSERLAPITFHAPPLRHFYGHGVFSSDGRLLYTTENDFENGAGIIGVWDVMAGYRRIGELPAHGIGPHDINLLSDGRTLVVANGGIQTHPDYGRRPLNLATMAASLSYIDRATGVLVEKHTLAQSMEKVSIRHLDVGAHDTIVFGCQFKGPRTDVVDLVGFHKRGAPVRFLSQTPALHRALRHYVSSIAVDRSGALCAVTSSRGQHSVIIDIERQSVVAMHALADVSGIAPATLVGQFVATSGSGHFALADPQRSVVHATAAPWSWDNHAVRFDL